MSFKSYLDLHRLIHLDSSPYILPVARRSPCGTTQDSNDSAVDSSCGQLLLLCWLMSLVMIQLSTPPAMMDTVMVMMMTMVDADAVMMIDAGASMMVMIGTAMMVLLDDAGRC